MEENPEFNDESSVLPSKQEKKRLNILKIAFYVLLILCLALSLYAWHTWKQSDSRTLLAIVFSCLVTKIGCVIGLLGSFKTIQDLKAVSLKKISYADTWGHQILIVALYFLILVMTLFIVFGSRALFYSDRSVAYLNAKFRSDHEEWRLRYGDKSIEEVEFWVLIMTNVVGYTSYIIVLFILVIIQMLMGIAVKYEIINSVMSLVSLAILFISGAVVYILVYAVRFKQMMDFHISSLLIVSNVALAFFLLLTAVYGFAVAVADKAKYLRAYVGLCVLTASLGLVASKFSIGVSRDLATQLGSNCFDFMAMVHEDYITTLGCGNKYLNYSDHYLNHCDRSQHRYVWEEKGKYACLNPLCCQILITDSKAKFDYLAICSAGSIALVLLALMTSFYVYIKPKIKYFNTPQQHGKILSALFFFSVLWIYLISFKIPPVPATVPYKNPAVKVSNSGIIDPRLVYPGYCLIIDSYELNTDKCEDCLRSEYVGKVLGKGILFIDSPEEKSSSEASFKTQDPEKLKDWVSKLRLCPENYYQKWQLVLEKNDFSKSGESSLAALYQSTIETPGKDLTLKVFGKVLSEAKPVDCLVTVTGFGLAKETLSKFGEFWFDLPAPSYNIPYLVNLTYSLDSHSIQRSFKVSGLPGSYSSIPATTFVSGSGVFKVAFSCKFLYSPSSPYTIEIRRGQQVFQGPFQAAAGSIDLEKGVYSILASANGFKSDLREVLIDQDLNLTLFFYPDKLQNDEVLIVLSWQGPDEIDFKVSFILNEEVYCEVSYVNKVCGGTKIVFVDESLDSKVLVVRVRPIGAYQYFFYANFQAKAEIMADVKVYAPGFVLPVYAFQFGNSFMDEDQRDKVQVWAGFCLNGLDGVGSLKEVNTYVEAENLPRLRDVCQEFYGPVKVFPVEFEQTLQVHKGKVLPNNVTRRF